MMDALNDPKIEMVTLMTSAQVGKTEVVLCIIGYYIDQDSSPMLVIMPTLEMGMALSKDRLAPMIRDMECLREKVSEVKSKDGGNTLLHKTFPGGHITIAGANSPASLASRPVRIVLFDEVDKYPASAGTEGDPVKLGMKRTQTFWNRKIILNSTPTIAGVSRIEFSFLQSDQRYYYVPCPKCNHFQILKWGQVQWDRDGNKNLLDTIRYECENCKARLTEADKFEMVAKGEWKKHAPEVLNHAGFHINELYSPWSSFREIAEEFLEAKKRPETLKVWKNTVLGETFEEEESFTISDERLAVRIEHYEKVPFGVLLLTSGSDVQDDRIEVVIKGWGKNYESWFIERRIFYGDTNNQEVYEQAHQFISQGFEHESGIKLKVIASCIDSGHRSTAVYPFVKRHHGDGYFAVKGYGGGGKPFIGKITYNNKFRARLLPLGVDEAKRTIYDRLDIDEHGTGYMHFSSKCDEDYFKQLTSEKQITKYDKGFPKKIWELIGGRRNEMLDCEVYNLAAFTILQADMDKVAENLERKIEAMPKKDEPVEAEPIRNPRPRRQSSWMSGWMK